VCCVFCCCSFSALPGLRLLDLSANDFSSTAGRLPDGLVLDRCGWCAAPGRRNGG
jgi:hypothetical protein